MQEREIREKLNQELEEMAPDLLGKICAEPIKPLKNEKELFGKKRPLFKEKKQIKKYFWAPAMVAAAACIAIIIFFATQPGVNSQKNVFKTQVAFNITIDVNPSISIEVNENGTVNKIKAENKDARKIVKQVNQKLKEESDYNDAVKLVISKLRKNGYLKKDKSAMLVSVISDNKDMGKETLKEVKKNTKNYQKEKNIKCTTVYQNCERDNEIEKIAEKNSVSMGKAAFCKKIAEKEKTSIKKMCKENIYTLLKKAEESGAVNNEEFIIDDLEQITENQSGEIITTFETESESESINPEETTTSEAQETVTNDPDDENNQEIVTTEQMTD